MDKAESREEVLPRNDSVGPEDANAGAGKNSREEVLPRSDSVGPEDVNAGAEKNSREEVLPRGNDTTGSDVVNAGAEDKSREEVLPRTNSVGSDDVNSGTAKNDCEEALPQEDDDMDGSDVTAEQSAEGPTNGTSNESRRSTHFWSRAMHEAEKDRTRQLKTKKTCNQTGKTAEAKENCQRNRKRSDKSRSKKEAG